MSVVLNEDTANACSDGLAWADEVLISAATLTEALIVAAGRGRLNPMRDYIGDVSPTVCPVTEAMALRAADAYRRWGRGFHPAALNFGDCFAYALARERNCPLLFVGDDFSRTDIAPALPKT